MSAKVPDSFSMRRIFDGDAKGRMKELRALVTFVLHNRGMDHLLQAMIAVLKSAPYARKDYIKLLISDLETTLKHYEARWYDEEAASRVLVESVAELARRRRR